MKDTILLSPSLTKCLGTRPLIFRCALIRYRNRLRTQGKCSLSVSSLFLYSISLQRKPEITKDSLCYCFFCLFVCLFFCVCKNLKQNTYELQQVRHRNCVKHKQTQMSQIEEKSKPATSVPLPGPGQLCYCFVLYVRMRTITCEHVSDYCRRNIPIVLPNSYPTT